MFVCDSSISFGTNAWPGLQVVTPVLQIQSPNQQLKQCKLTETSCPEIPAEQMFTSCFSKSRSLHLQDVSVEVRASRGEARLQSSEKNTMEQAGE